MKPAKRHSTRTTAEPDALPDGTAAGPGDVPVEQSDRAPSMIAHRADLVAEQPEEEQRGAGEADRRPAGRRRSGRRVDAGPAVLHSRSAMPNASANSRTATMAGVR